LSTTKCGAGKERKVDCGLYLPSPPTPELNYLGETRKPHHKKSCLGGFSYTHTSVLNKKETAIANA